MFISAIESVSDFTRPIHTISRTYGGKQVSPGSATLFFVNEDACAVTCKHVAELLMSSDQINNQFFQFRNERQQLSADGKYKAHAKGLELKYKYNADSLIQVKNNFIDCIDTMSGFTSILHPTLDLAIIKFNDYKNTYYKGFARFVKDSSTIKPGKFLCRLGFPFPEFNNFRYNNVGDDIEWINEGIMHSPRFPIEGMVTRFLAENNQLYGIEMSTPGLRGQSGGPLFDDQGIIYGMQYSTKHLHLGFDIVDKEIQVNNAVKKISDYSFLHLGQCIHVDAIKSFLAEHSVKFYEA